jgi:hypothetical protein
MEIILKCVCIACTLRARIVTVESNVKATDFRSFSKRSPRQESADKRGSDEIGQQKY